MARKSFSAAIGTDLGQGRYTHTQGEVPDALAATALVVTTDVAAAIAVLVADAGSPTQAHVTTLNTAWGILLPLITTAKAAGAGDVVLSVDNSNVTSNNALQSAVRALLRLVQSDANMPA